MSLAHLRDSSGSAVDLWSAEGREGHFVMAKHYKCESQVWISSYSECEGWWREAPTLLSVVPGTPETDTPLQPPGPL